MTVGPMAFLQDDSDDEFDSLWLYDNVMLAVPAPGGDYIPRCTAQKLSQQKLKQ